MFNGTISFEHNGYTVQFKDINTFTDGTQLTGEILNDRDINWSEFEINDDLWYADGAKSVKCIDIDRNNKIISFGY